MTFLWTTIHVTDMERSLSFYQEIVGLPLQRRVRSGEKELAFLGEDGTAVELVSGPEYARVSFGSDIALGFRTDDLDATIAFLEEKGIPVAAGPFRPNSGIRFLYVCDPDGMKIQFAELS